MWVCEWMCVWVFVQCPLFMTPIISGGHWRERERASDCALVHQCTTHCLVNDLFAPACVTATKSRSRRMRRAPFWLCCQLTHTSRGALVHQQMFNVVSVSVSLCWRRRGPSVLGPKKIGEVDDRELCCPISVRQSPIELVQQCSVKFGCHFSHFHSFLHLLFTAPLLCPLSTGPCGWLAGWLADWSLLDTALNERPLVHTTFCNWLLPFFCWKCFPFVDDVELFCWWCWAVVADDVAVAAICNFKLVDPGTAL